MNLSHLKQISDLKYQKSEQTIANLRERERTLRAELSRLQALARETHSTPASDAELRAIGGDVIWLQWLGSAQRQLNIELAQVLAQKENLMQTHRRASGKKAVSDALVQNSARSASQSRAKRTLDQAIETSLVQSAFSSLGARSRQ